MAKVKMGLRLLETLTSALYDDPIVLFREYVQNSVDAYTQAIKDDSSNAFKNFFVDISIDQKNCSINIKDNGYGIPENKFHDKMTDIGYSDKSQSIDQIGFRGIGRLSAIPFCDELIFTNKLKGTNFCQIFRWKGVEYNELLNKKSDTELGAAIEKFTKFKKEPYNGKPSDHFFHVTINNYNVEIKELIKQPDFKYKLSLMLPLKYDPNFSFQNKIKERYFSYMNEKLDKYSFIIKLNNDELFKPYDNTNILDSDIFFWELSLPSKDNDIPGEPIGLLWYTFNLRMIANPKDTPFGILVRSKNMLMGNNNTLVDAVFRNNNEYIATYRELTQTIQGVYGEMLLNTPRLNDNARRDWFKLDETSMFLRHIISNFLKHLFNYRKKSSEFFNKEDEQAAEKSKQKLRNALIELTSTPDTKKLMESFSEDRREYLELKKKKKTEKNKSNTFNFADEDIPNSSLSFKRQYEQILSVIYDYYSISEKPQEFLKLRSYIKKRLNNE